MKIPPLSLLILITACSSSKEAQNRSEVPPTGTLWENRYNYTEVYSTPDVLPEPQVGYAVLMKYVQAELQKTPCTDKKRLVLMAVIDEQGKVMGVHTHQPTNEACEGVGARAIKQFQFKPGMLEGKPVKSVFAVPVNFKK